MKCKIELLSAFSMGMVVISLGACGLGSNVHSKVVPRKTYSMSRSHFGKRERALKWVAEENIPKVSLNDVEFLSRSDGWVVGDKGILLETEDGGKSWKSHDLGKGITLNSVDFANVSKGWVAGRGVKKVGGTERLIILGTKDGGRKWLIEKESGNKHGNMYCSGAFGAPNLKASLYKVIVTGNNAGLAIGSKIYRTVDGGLQWTFDYGLINSHIKGMALCGFRGGALLKSGQGWLVGSGRGVGFTMIGLIFHTLDVGGHWSLQNGSSFMRPLNAVYFVNDSDGWVVGQDGEIFSSTDAGGKWYMQISGSVHQLNSVFFLNASEGWVVGNSGVILATTDGGRHWFRENSGTRANLHSVYCVPSGCWAVGSHGTILHLRLGHG